MCPLEAVIFDLDGVLTETSRQHFIAWKQLSKTLGFVLADEVNNQVKGISRMESLEIVLKHGGMLHCFNEVEKQELAAQKNAIYQSLIAQFTRENLSQGALELLIALKESNIKLGLASVSRNAPFLLNAMEIGKFFDAVADPSEIAFGKPAPDIFLLAAKLLDVKPENCIGIEDAFAGVEAIKAAGMLPIGIGSREVLYNCDIVVSDFADLNFRFLQDLLDK